MGVDDALGMVEKIKQSRVARFLGIIMVKRMATIGGNELINGVWKDFVRQRI